MKRHLIEIETMGHQTARMARKKDLARHLHHQSTEDFAVGGREGEVK